MRARWRLLTAGLTLALGVAAPWAPPAQADGLPPCGSTWDVDCSGYWGDAMMATVSASSRLISPGEVVTVTATTGYPDPHWIWTDSGHYLASGVSFITVSLPYLYQGATLVSYSPQSSATMNAVVVNQNAVQWTGIETNDENVGIPTSRFPTGSAFTITVKLPDTIPTYLPIKMARAEVTGNLGYVGFQQEAHWIMTTTPPLQAGATVTPTGTVGEYDVSTVVTSSAPGVTTTAWNFGDGTSAQTSGASTARHRFTKPGQHTITGVVTDSAGQVQTITRSVTVAAPSLSLSLSTPGHQDGQLPADSTVDVVVTALASDTGVGDLSELAFQGGEFTAAPGDVLSYTTPATPPFSLEPGGTNSWTTKVKTGSGGKVSLHSVLIGHDAAGANASASASRDLTVASAAGQKGATANAPSTFGPKSGVSTSSVSAVSASGTVTTTLSNSNTFPVAAAVQLTGSLPRSVQQAHIAAKSVALSGKVTKTLKAGAKVKVTLHLTKAAKAAVAAHTLPARRVVTLTSPSGEKRVSSTSVKLKGTKVRAL